jgi:hypothetical protein
MRFNNEKKKGVKCSDKLRNDEHCLTLFPGMGKST